MNILTQGLSDLFHSTGIYILTVGQVIMILISCILLYLAIVKKFEPLLLLPIAFGMLLANMPGAGIINMDLFLGEN